MNQKKQFSYNINVRYNECDPTGFAFNANFFVWIQEATGRYWRDLGIDVFSLAQGQQTFMAVHLSCDFKRPVAFGDVIQISPKVTELGSSSVSIQWEMFNGDTLSAVGRSVHAFLDLKRKKKLPLTDDLRKKFEVSA